jgi:hypothetical protein
MNDGMGNFLSPEGLIMLPLAVMLDLTGIILVCFGLDDFFITDAIGWLTIGTWSMFYSQMKAQVGGTETETEAEMPELGEKRKAAKEIRTTREAQQAAETGAEAEKAAGQAEKTIKTTGQTKKASNAAKWGKRLKFLELIPYVGALPLWTVSVYFELKD